MTITAGPENAMPYPDHLLYHILKMVPVCCGSGWMKSCNTRVSYGHLGCGLRVFQKRTGSTCGRAGLFLRIMTFLTFLGTGAATSPDCAETTAVSSDIGRQMGVVLFDYLMEIELQRRTEKSY